jgi:hypothetical protein
MPVGKVQVNLVRRNHVIAIETLMTLLMADCHMVLQAINGVPADTTLLSWRMRLLHMDA